jgi:two-component system chemotaxis response regulator CheY
MSPTEGAGNHSFLIVEDNVVILHILTSLLTIEGYKIAGIACNGLDAVRLYRESQPDIVLMDIMLPELDGLEATRRILELDPNAKIIMISSVAESDIVKKAIHLGAKDYISKPVHTERLFRVIHALMGKEAPAQENRTST